MTSFLKKAIHQILSDNLPLTDVVFVLPNQRAGVYVKKFLKEGFTQTSILPEIITFDNLAERISGITKTSSIELLFDFYKIHLDNTPQEKQDSFEIFSHWAKTVLNDFNLIDNYLVNPNDVFKTLKEINILHNWNPNTDLSRNYLHFLQQLDTYYHAFYNYLLENQKAYQGLLFRESVEVLEHFAINTDKNYIFLGFGQLKKAEQIIIQQLLLSHKASVYWDIPKDFLTQKTKENLFFKDYFTNWSYYIENEVQWVFDEAVSTNTIEVIGIPKKTGMLKYLGQALQKQSLTDQTAVILADQNLLPATLQSLPKEIESINITMGVPLKNFSFFSLIQSVLELHTQKDTLHKGFYYQPVLKILKHADFKKIDKKLDIITAQLTALNKVYLKPDDLQNAFKDLPEKTQKILVSVFAPIDETDFKTLINRINALILFLKPTVNSVEREVLFHHYQLHQKLIQLLDKYPFITGIKSLKNLYGQLVFSDHLNFIGEPLQGLQIMGFLETQALDFKNMYLVSVNEGTLPPTRKTDSFIPFDVRKHYGIPTYQEEEMMSAYLFNRLLQRSQKITLLYNTDTDTFGSGEKSRFITQLLWKYPYIKHSIADTSNFSHSLTLQKVPKTSAILEKIKNLFQTGISPSALATYMYNPIDFYRQKILGIKELEEVEETVAENTLGTIVHASLETIYTPFIGTYLDAETLKKSLTQTEKVVSDNFIKNYPNGDISQGKNKLIYEVAVNFVNRFIKQEINQLEEDNQIKIIGLEQELTESFTFQTIGFPVTFHGFVDRIDLYNGTLRIIDYKTGKVESPQMRMSRFQEKYTDYKYSKGLQVLLYSCMVVKYLQHDLENQPMQAGIISFKNHKSGFLPANFGEIRQPNDFQITVEKQTDFLMNVEKLLLEILHPEMDFVEKEV